MKFAEVLEMMGAKVTWTDTSVSVTGPPRQPFGRKHLGLLWIGGFSQDFHGISILRIVSYKTHLDQRIEPLKFLRIGSSRC